MPFDEELPEWKKDDPDARPAQSKLDEGFKAGEKPPASAWNWFANRTYRALKQLFDNAIHKETLGQPGGPAKLDENGKLVAGQENTVEIKDASLTEKGITILSNLINGSREDKAATEKAVKDASDFFKNLGFNTIVKNLNTPNLNTFTDTGFYYVNNGVNLPLSYSHGYILNFSISANYVLQLYVNSLGASTSYIYKRVRVNGVWSPWLAVIDDSMRNVANGFAGLDGNGKIPTSLTPQLTKIGEINVGTSPTTNLSFGSLSGYKKLQLRFLGFGHNNGNPMDVQLVLNDNTNSQDFVGLPPNFGTSYNTLLPVFQTNSATVVNGVVDITNGVTGAYGDSSVMSVANSGGQQVRFFHYLNTVNTIRIKTANASYLLNKGIVELWGEV